MRLKDEAIRRSGEILIFPLEKIEIKIGFNLRDMQSESTKTYIREMADCIKSNGTAIIPPITLWQEDGHIYIDEGHCRFSAHLIAKEEGAPVVGIRAYAVCDILAKSEAERTVNMFHSNTNLPLTPLEKANGVKRLLSFHWTLAEIAKKLGVTPQGISNMLAFADLPASAAEMVEKGEVSPTLAIETVRQQGALMGTDALQTAVKTANEKGKSHATKKHLPPQVKSNRITPEPEEIRQTKHKFSWDEYGPKVKDHLEAVCHAFPTNNHPNVTRARDFLKEMDKMGL